MERLQSAAFAAVNLPYTMALIGLTAYWLLQVVGLVDLDAYLAGRAGRGQEGPPLGGRAGHPILRLLDVGQAPVMFPASVAILAMWIVSLKLNDARLDAVGQYQGWYAAGLAIPNLLFGLLVAMLVAAPFKWLNQSRAPEALVVGRPCVITSPQVTEQSGQCEVQTANAPVIVSARTCHGEVLQQGETAVIVERDKRKRIYTVTKHLGAT